MSEVPSRSLLIDAVAWQETARPASVEIPWKRLKQKLLDPLDSVEIGILLTPSQHDTLPEDFTERFTVYPVSEQIIRNKVLDSFIEKGALILSSRPVMPYDRWLPARVAAEAPMGVHLAMKDGIKRFLKNGVVKALPKVRYPLAELLNDFEESAGAKPAFQDILSLVPLPSAPFELYERIYTLSDEKLVVHLDRYLHSKLQDLVLFHEFTEEEVEEIIDERRLTQRIRLAWAQQLQMEATASVGEMSSRPLSGVEAVLGFPAKAIAKEEVERRVRALPLSAEATTVAYKVGDQIHVLNPDPEQEAELKAMPFVKVHARRDSAKALLELNEKMATWTIDHYRADPQMDGLLVPLLEAGHDPATCRYALAYINYLNSPAPAPVPAPLREWRAPLSQMLELAPPETSLLFPYPTRSESSKNKEYMIIEKTSERDPRLYSPMHCLPTPVPYTTINRHQSYVKVGIASAWLGYRKEDIFTASYEYDAVSSEEAEREATTTSLSTPATVGGQDQDKELYAEYPFRNAGLDKEYVVFPLRHKDGSDSSLDVDEFLQFFQINQALRRISERLSGHERGRVPNALAKDVAGQVQKLFAPFKREQIYFTSREGAALTVDVPWRELDLQVGALWLSLRHAIRTQQGLQLHNGAVLLPLSEGIGAEVVVRPLAAGVSLPFEVSAWQEQHPAPLPDIPARGGLPFTLPQSLSLPSFVQLVGHGHCVELRFVCSPLLAPFATSISLTPVTKGGSSASLPSISFSDGPTREIKVQSIFDDTETTAEVVLSQQNDQDEKETPPGDT